MPKAAPVAPQPIFQMVLWPDRHNRSDFRCSPIGKNVTVTISLGKDSCSGLVFSWKAEGMPAIALTGHRVPARLPIGFRDTAPSSRVNVDHGQSRRHDRCVSRRFAEQRPDEAGYAARAR